MPILGRKTRGWTGKEGQRGVDITLGESEQRKARARRRVSFSVREGGRGALGGVVGGILGGFGWEWCLVALVGLGFRSAGVCWVGGWLQEGV